MWFYAFYIVFLLGFYGVVAMIEHKAIEKLEKLGDDLEAKAARLDRTIEQLEAGIENLNAKAARMDEMAERYISAAEKLEAKEFDKTVERQTKLLRNYTVK